MKKKILKFFTLACIGFIFFSACKKDTFITSASAFLNFSADTLHFDTVFTSAGSFTQTLKIFNLNDKPIKISSIELAGAQSSSFKLNVNGVPGSSFSNISIAASDSIYVFVSVTVNPDQTNIPFLIQDSISINYNGNNKYVQLDAYGRNAKFLNDVIVTKDSTITSELPLVILGSLTVNQNAILTINKGTQIYCHQNAAININGTLKANGDKKDSQIVFTNDRLDDPYKYYPGSWQGINFSATSINNELNSVVIKNATQAINISGAGNSLRQLYLNSCIITNNQHEGIKAISSNIYAENCLITNCGLNNLSLNAGIYNFTFCTVASYSNVLLNSNAPVLLVSDTLNATQTANLSASFVNDIFYGNSGLTEDEIVLLKNGSNFTAQFSNVLYKGAMADASVFKNSINGEDPLFVNIDAEHAVYDFHLTEGSPCIDAGQATSVNTDLDGNPRTSGTSPDIGCYEFQ